MLLITSIIRPAFKEIGSADPNKITELREALPSLFLGYFTQDRPFDNLYAQGHDKDGVAKMVFR